jgi:UDP-N-acetylmuramyl tripeptide synthase
VLKLRVEGQTETKTTATLCDEKDTLAISSNMTGLFNMYNLAAAIVLTKTLGYTPQQLITATKQYAAAFGRLEKIAVADKKYILTLIKNPTGFTESLKTMQIIEQEYENAWFILNDNFADGKDVSWIWDVDIATYISPQIQKISVSGTRKYDMALRLEYAGVPKETIHVYETWEEMFAADKNTQTKNTTPVYATYTAMLSLQKYIGDHGIKQTYWSE